MNLIIKSPTRELLNTNRMGNSPFMFGHYAYVWIRAHVKLIIHQLTISLDDGILTHDLLIITPDIDTNRHEPNSYNPKIDAIQALSPETHNISIKFMEGFYEEVDNNSTLTGSGKTTIERLLKDYSIYDAQINITETKYGDKTLTIEHQYGYLSRTCKDWNSLAHYLYNDWNAYQHAADIQLKPKKPQQSTFNL